ncbi:dipeptidase [Rufibacter glacialis]|uniref:Peptidase n=1 Tax=Rufibacter glacialis TaxID=1259555 RepID=A0A5M8QSA3_9BACT|nr:membrane dipeptidase [Rufibacter glacialis]KAA6438111.1 peptidase [Rufibacter glacialis]GGK88671.1 dipeptidase [Rufibacter glacialis]
MNLPIIDLHCDLTGYLAWVPGSSAMDVDRIGCAIPHLQAGRVRLQTMAFFTPTEAGSAAFTLQQARLFKENLLQNKDVFAPLSRKDLQNQVPQGERVALVAAIENASGLCEEEEPLELAFTRLEEIIRLAGPLLYLSLTHAEENRFSGGNFTPGVGLKPDGKELLRYLSGRRIALDLSHTSDAAAYGILTFLDKNRLEIPILASHSNFREVYDHPRNLPMELVQEVVRREGLIGMNFLKKFVHPEQPDFLLDHIRYGFTQAPQALAFGADFFQEAGVEGESYFHAEHRTARHYQAILTSLKEEFSPEQLAAISHRNALRFLERLWG